MASQKINQSAKADVDKNFEKQAKQLQKLAGEEHIARTTGAQQKWMRPADWGGDLFDYDEMSTPFDREQSNQSFIDATKDSDSPGVVGDLMVTTTQVDHLAIMERAFRARHTMRRPRAVAHAMGRKRGHGHDEGPLVIAWLEYVRGMVEQSKSISGGG